MSKQKYKMVTYTFSPHPDIKKMPDAFRKKWAKALRHSKQAKAVLARRSGAMCCLGVGCAIQGFPLEDMIGKTMPISMGRPAPWVGKKAGNKWSMAWVAVLMAAHDHYGREYSFNILNDAFLNHPQIGDLLDGKEVTVKKRRSVHDEDYGDF